MKDKRVKQGSWKTLYLVYIADVDGIQNFCGLYRTRSGAVSRCFVERGKLLLHFAELTKLPDKVWSTVYERAVEGMKSDNPDEWYNGSFECPMIKEMEVLDEF